MRRSRNLTFKKEQEDKLKHLIHSKPDERKEEVKVQSLKRTAEAPQRTTSIATPVSSKKEPVKKEPVYSDEEEEQEVSRYSEEEYEQEEEELPKPQPKVTKKIEPVASPRKQTKQVKTEEVIVKKEEVETARPSKKKPVEQKRPVTAGRKRPVQEEREEQEEEEEKDQKEEREDDDRRRFLVPKSLLVKFISNAEIDTASSEIYPYLQQEMLDYIVEVIKIVSSDDADDEVVIKDSNLRFLGDKSKSVGILDQKSFERLYAEVRKNIRHNVTFTSESYKSLCKYTEIHTLDFLRKARAIMVHSGRKRLNLGDIELLKYILE